MERQLAMFNIREKPEICDVEEINCFEFSDKFNRVCRLGDHDDVASTEELGTEYVEDDSCINEELVNTDRQRQEPKDTQSSQLDDVSTVVTDYTTLTFDENDDENNGRECLSPRRGGMRRYVEFRRQSSTEYSSCEAVENITASVTAQEEVHKSMTAVICQDQVLKDMSLTTSQREIITTKPLTMPESETIKTKLPTVSHDDILKNITPTSPQDQILKNIRTLLMSEDETVKLKVRSTTIPQDILEAITTSNFFQRGVHENMTGSPMFQPDKGSKSPDIVAEHAFIEHCCYGDPHSLLKTFTKQLSITSELQLDEASVDEVSVEEVSVDGVDEDKHTTISTQKVTRPSSETRNVGELQTTNTTELLERGQCEQNFALGRKASVTAHSCGSTAYQSAQSVGPNNFSSIAGHRIDGSGHQVPRFLQTSQATRVPTGLRHVPENTNQFLLQMSPPASCFNDSSNDANIRRLYSSHGRPPGNNISSSGSSSDVPATTPSSASLLSDTEDRRLMTYRMLATKAGQNYCHKERSPPEGDDIGKHEQINLHSGAKTRSKLSQQHLEQTNQPYLPRRNSQADQYSYLYGKPIYNQHKMLDSRLHTETNSYEQPCSNLSYEQPCPNLPDFSKLSNDHPTKKTTSKKQTSNIAQQFHCPQEYYQLHENPHFHTPDSFGSSAKVSSYDVTRTSHTRHTHQQGFNNRSITCETKTQLNAHRSTCKSSAQTGPSQSRHNQSAEAGNHCLVQKLNFMHGEYQHPLDYEIMSRGNLHSRNKTSDSPLQQPCKPKGDFIDHSSSETTTKAQTEKSPECHRNRETCQPQLKMFGTRMNKCAEWLFDGKNRNIGENSIPYDYNNHRENMRLLRYNNSTVYTENDIEYATKRDELAEKQAQTLPEKSILPIGLFDGKPLPDSHELKSGLTKKHGPHKTCHKETVVKKGNQKNGSPKEVSKIQAQTSEKNASDTCSVQFQHHRNAESDNSSRPILTTEKNIEKIRGKQLPKYPYSFSADSRFNETKIQKADAAIDEEIRLLDEKSLKKNMLESSSSSDCEPFQGKDISCLLPEEPTSSNSSSSSNGNKGMTHQASEHCKHDHRQLHCDPVPKTRSNKTPLNEKSTLMSRDKHKVQTSNKHNQHEHEDTSRCCQQQINQKYYGNTVEQFHRNNAFSCESSEPNFLYPDVNRLKAEHDRMSAYKEQSNVSNDLGSRSYHEINYKNVESTKLQYKTTEQQTALGTLPNHPLSSCCAKEYLDVSSVENANSHQFLDVTQNFHPLTWGLPNAFYHQPQAYSYGREAYLIPDVSNKGSRHNEISCHNRDNFIFDHTPYTHSNIWMSQYMPPNFESDHGPSFVAPTNESQLASSSSQSKTHQPSCCKVLPPNNQPALVSTSDAGCSVLPSSQATIVSAELPISTGASSTSSSSNHDTPFKIPYSPSRQTCRSNPQCNETIPTTPCYSSIDTTSDVSMRSDNSLSRSRASNISSSGKCHSCHNDLAGMEALTSYQSHHQGPQFPHEQLQQNYSSQSHSENQRYKETQPRTEIQCCFRQSDKQMGSEDGKEFQRCCPNERMHLPCFLQSAIYDSNVKLCSSSDTSLISSHFLHQISGYQTGPRNQSETLESIMTSMSEKSEMSTGTSDDCYTNKTQSSEPEIKDTANAGTLQGNYSPANVDLSHSAQATSTTGSFPKQSSGSSKILTNTDTNIQSSVVSQFVDTTSDVFPALNFEDCRDTMPLSLSSSTDMEPDRTSTTPRQALVKDGGLCDHGGSDEATLRSCAQKNVDHISGTNATVSASTFDSHCDNQVLGHSKHGSSEEETVNLFDLPFLSDLEDDLNVESKNQQIKDMLQNANKK